MPRLILRISLGTCLLAAAAVSSSAAVLPPGFTETLVAGGLLNPTAMQFAPDGRLFVCQQGGALRVIKNGALLSAPFVSVGVNQSGERGLLGVAFDPDFATNQYVYIYYTTQSAPIHNRVSRFSASGDVAAPGSEVVIVDLDNLTSATNHNGGAIDFGPDGKLYVAVGDNANGANAQSMSTRHGKMLRFNADGTIPTDNPFYTTASGANRAIWALGLRNPFTFAQNPGGPAPTLLINDVGQVTWEEVNDGIAGANYGWPATEGPTTNPAYQSPRHAYDHGASGGCAITGGAFYAPPVANFPAEYLNDYFFADYCSGWIRRLDPANGNAMTGFATGVSSPVDLKVGADGHLYYLARGSGAVFRVHFGTTAPTITTHPAHRTVSPGQPAAFSVVASGTPTLVYQWQRNNVNIPNATAASYTVSSPVVGDNGARFRVNVANSAGNVFSQDAVLTVTTNQAPVATITQPAAGTRYAGGMSIAFGGSGADPEDGPLPPGAFTWRVDFHHDTHTHPFMPSTSGVTSGAFVIPSTGETSANVWYRVHLTVRDSGGRTHAAQRDVFPLTVRLTLATSPIGLEVRLDGQPMTAPVSFDSVVGIVRTIEAPGQTSGGTSYALAAWSDGGAPGRTIVTPAANATYTATFRATSVSSPPSVPSGLVATPNGLTVHLAWNRSGGATSYRLEAGSGSGLANLLSADVGDAGALQGVVAPGTYFLRVRALNAVGVSAPSNEVSVTTGGTAVCAAPPPAPSGYSAQTGGLLAALAWTASPGAESYVLEAGSSTGLSDLTVANVGSATSFSTTAAAGTYFTRVRGVNACGPGAASGEVAVTLGCAPGAVAPGSLTVTRTAGTAVFSWLAPLGATSYRLQAGTAPGTSDVADVDVGGAATASVSLAGVASGIYYVRVTAVSACGVGAPSNEVTVTVP